MLCLNYSKIEVQSMRKYVKISDSIVKLFYTSKIRGFCPKHSLLI